MAATATATYLASRPRTSPRPVGRRPSRLRRSPVHAQLGRPTFDDDVEGEDDDEEEDEDEDVMTGWPGAAAAISAQSRMAFMALVGGDGTMPRSCGKSAAQASAVAQLPATRSLGGGSE